ncbi:MAG: prepilin-type N-terminal cleavage/methylation domain-containing protein [Chitinispirillia bacterium]|nr:prepilin-type N-terminal cleavage/methylation domain-containing protein [Chitinispirillia bacterium]MCL2242119.1 prepilin-type N-terminal cleavage/methylation domain-containing protein [Chitinispirillia bacterium]
MQKYLKNNKGFTLVEVIVVAVIVLVLAAVAIPLYNGYIEDSRRSSVENAAGTIASGLGAAVQTGATVSTDAAMRAFKITPVGGGADSYIQVPKDMTATAAGSVLTVAHAKWASASASVQFTIPGAGFTGTITATP